MKRLDKNNMYKSHSTFTEFCLGYYSFEKSSVLGMIIYFNCYYILNYFEILMITDPFSSINK